MVDVPAASVVTVTLAEVAPPVKKTVAGTVAAAVLLELRLIVSPPVGAWPLAKVNVSTVEPLAPTLTAVGENAIVGAVTVVVPVPVIVRPLPFQLETVPVINEVPID